MASVSALNIALIFKHSSESRKKNLNLNYTHPLDDEIDFEKETENKKESFSNLKNIELIRFNELKEKIEQINYEEYTKNIFCDKVLSTIASQYEVFQGIFYTLDKDLTLSISGSYAYNKSTDTTLKLGEGLAGQVAKAKRTVNIKQIPSGYIKAVSGLGEATPSNLLICPLLESGETRGVIEIATFKEFSKEEETYFTTLGEIINEKLSHLI